MKTDCQEFIGMLFLSRDLAHSAHLKSESYSQHKALGKFYVNIVDLADKFAETYMGRHGKLIGDIPRMDAPKGDITKTLNVILEVLEESREAVAGEDSTLNNVIDEIVAEFLSVIYKLKFLK